jgi:hypothetical protein
MISARWVNRHGIWLDSFEPEDLPMKHRSVSQFSTLTCLFSRRRLHSVLRRLILKVVTMVLRGAQFQQSEPARCKFLTRRALSAYRATFVHSRSDTDCLPQGRRTTHRRLMHSYGMGQCWQPHKGLASYSASGQPMSCGNRRRGCVHMHSLDDLNLYEGRKRWDRQRQS